MYKVYSVSSDGLPVLLGTFALCCDAFLFVDAWNARWESQISAGLFGRAYWVREK